MSDLIDTSERYHLIGVNTRDNAVDGAGRNIDVPAGENPEGQKVQGEVVYTTNDKDEANAIARNGGFQREGGPWIAVQGWRDMQSQGGASAGADSPSPLKRPV